MTTLADLVTFLDWELRISELPDYPAAMNGLQLENGGRVSRVAAAVDASLPVVEKAVAAGADLLLVHHGMFWQGARAVTGAQFTKLKTAMDAGLAVYSAHLPLDVHPDWGNNICLMRAIGISDAVPFMDWKGMPLGLRAEIDLGREEFVDRVGQAVGGPVHLCPGGPGRVRRVGVITGGAGSQIEEVVASGVDTFVTGEGPHWSYPLAEELGLNVLYAGHYATETFGVRRLAQELEREFGIPWEFLDHPTGL